jgi:hypothetical protein
VLNEIRFLKGVLIPDNQTLLKDQLRFSGLRFKYESFAKYPTASAQIVQILDTINGIIVFFTFIPHIPREPKQNNLYDIYLYYRNELDIVHHVLLTNPDKRFDLQIFDEDDSVCQHVYLPFLIDSISKQLGVAIEEPSTRTPEGYVRSLFSGVDDLTKLSIPRNDNLDEDLDIIRRMVHEHTRLRKLL